MSSSMTVGDNVLPQSDDGRSTFLEAKTGTTIWSERLGTHHNATPLLIKGLIYCLAAEGAMHVLRLGIRARTTGEDQLGRDLPRHVGR